MLCACSQERLQFYLLPMKGSPKTSSYAICIPPLKNQNPEVAPFGAASGENPLLFYLDNAPSRHPPSLPNLFLIKHLQHFEPELADIGC